MRKPVFKSWNSYWGFDRSIRNDYRYVHSSEARSFLRTVRATCKKRSAGIKKASVVWRAQSGHDWRPIDVPGGRVEEIPCAFGAKRMKPLSGKATEGRANPKGIPVLYVANNMKTAISEVRPWIGSLVSVARLITKRRLVIINCFERHAESAIEHMYIDEPSARKREIAVWAAIDRAFARPVTTSDNSSDYSATQILAELFKSMGYDGVAYKSSLVADGYNIALFDVEAADVDEIGLEKITAIQVSSENEEEFWPVKK